MNNEKLKPGKVFTNGLITENPTFRLVLGTCPTMAVTTSALNGLGMGLAATFVLLLSNTLISLLRKVIPDKIRIPAYITIIATCVTVIDMLLKKFTPELYESLGLFIPLIVVNCIILGRAEAFASKHSVGLSALDGIGMGLGFTMSLTTLGIIREFIGAGSVFGHKIPFLSNYSMIIFLLPAGGFLTFGLVMALINYVSDKITEKKKLALATTTTDVNVEDVVEGKKEVIKDEAPKTEVNAEVKAEPTKSEAPKTEVKTEPIKSEAPKEEPVKSEAQVEDDNKNGEDKE